MFERVLKCDPNVMLGAIMCCSKSQEMSNDHKCVHYGKNFKITSV